MASGRSSQNTRARSMEICISDLHVCYCNKNLGKCIEWDFLYKISAKQCKIGTLPSVSFEQILLDPFADRILEARSKYIERRINKINFFPFKKEYKNAGSIMQRREAHIFSISTRYVEATFWARNPRVSSLDNLWYEPNTTFHNTNQSMVCHK